MLFDGFKLSDPQNTDILSRYRLKVLSDRQYIQVSSYNFETDIIRLDQFLSGNEEIIEKQISNESKTVISKYLRKEQETVSQRISGKKETNGALSKEYLSKPYPAITENKALKRALKAIEIGTTPYIVSSANSFGIRLPEVVTLKVDIAPVLDYPDEVWLGLEIDNKEDYSINECFVELVEIENQNGSKEKITLPRTLGWSYAHESKDGILKIGRESKKKIDILRTHQNSNTFSFVGLDGRQNWRPRARDISC